MTTDIPYPLRARTPLEEALAKLAETTTIEEWDAEIRRRVVVLIRGRGETFETLARKGGKGHSWLAKKLGAAPARAFLLADLEAVLELLALPPMMLVEPPDLDDTERRRIRGVSRATIEAENSELLTWCSSNGSRATVAAAREAYPNADERIARLRDAKLLLPLGRRLTLTEAGRSRLS